MIVSLWPVLLLGDSTLFSGIYDRRRLPFMSGEIS